jgi:ubiquinone/menaquinone biosynthesis C-methylase UbiE
MDDKRPMSAQEASKPGFSYFEVQAYWGTTKHFGGVKATQELAEVCHVSQNKYVLEVGSGVGVTACCLAKRYGCSIVGLDLSERMVEWARRRAKRKGLAEIVEFKVGDAQDLPFEDGLFDAVICESVTAFPEDQARAVSEYVRVTKPGGYVGLNEGTWVMTPPPAELVEYIHRTMAGARFLMADGWRQLLEGAGLADIVVKTFKLSMLSQWTNEMGGMDAGDIIDRARSIGSFLSLYLRNPDFRKYAKEITPSGKVVRSLFTYLGYGIYAGRVLARSTDRTL